MPWFRRARPADPRWHLAKTFAQMLVFWTLFLFVIPPKLVEWSNAAGLPAIMLAPALRYAVAVALFLPASTLGVWSAWTMATAGLGTPLPLDAPSRLVTGGPYAHVRNPMAVAGLAQGAAVAAFHGSLAVALYVLVGGLAWHWLVRPVEEDDLARTFGAEFARYRARVPLWRRRRRTPAR